MKRYFLYIIFGACCVICFWGGRLWTLHDIKTYSVHGYCTAFHEDWPTYALPLKDYESVLSLLRNGKTENAIGRLEALLDMVIYDAEQRHALLKGEKLRELDKCVKAVALYRMQYPRPIPAYSKTNDPEYQVAKILLDVDNFLLRYQK